MGFIKAEAIFISFSPIQSQNLYLQKMRMKKYLLAMALFGLMLSCDNAQKPNKESNPEPEVQEAPSDEWIQLFDGSSMDAWKGWKKENVGAAWSIEDGILAFDPEVEDRGDIITRSSFDDFEFHLDWKISECGNSGIMWNVQEGEEYHAPYSTGPEMQILDNSCHPDGKIVTHRAGDLYDMIETSVVNVKPANEWNSIIIKSKDGRYEFWQNSEKVVEFEMHNENWDALVADSKFKDWKGFGEFKSGHIALQDHGDKIWFRNIKIKTL